MGKTLFMMLGYPGAGKTTAAKIIAEMTGAVMLSSDKLRLEMFPEPTFSPKEHQELYAKLDADTEEFLRRGNSVIYDANLNRFQHRQEKYDICQRTGAKPVLLWLQTPRDLAKERASHFSRQHLWPQNETAGQLFDRIAGLIEEPKPGEAYIAVDGTKVSPDYLKQLLESAEAI